MIYSRSTEYAIRALIPLAQVTDGSFTMVKTLAEQESIPPHYLAKILQQLARKGLVRSNKGPMGGFQLSMPPERISLLDIVLALEGPEPYLTAARRRRRLPDGLYCAMHDERIELEREILRYLRENSVAGLAQALETKRRAIARRLKRRAAGSSH